MTRPDGILDETPASALRLSIVTPLYRSADYIHELYLRLVAAVATSGYSDYELIFVNDASPDESLSIARSIAASDHRVAVIDLARNFGQHKAIMTGLRYTTGDLMFVLDSDLEEEPEWLLRFSQEMGRSKADVVFGVNRNIKRGYLYSSGRRIFYRSVNLLSGVDFPQNVCAVRLMTRRYVDALLSFKEREIFFVGMCWMAGFVQLPVEVVKRDTSPSTYTIRRLWALFLEGITSFSTRPLQIIAWAGLGLSFVAFVYVSMIIFRKLYYGINAEGWASVMGVVLTVGGVSLFFQGVIAIYVSKIFLEVKQRPLTIIRDVYRSEDQDREGPSPVHPDIA